jgi:hypothetical protein
VLPDSAGLSHDHLATSPIAVPKIQGELARSGPVREHIEPPAAG